MIKQKFNPDLAPEMEWSECVLAASLADGNEDFTTWICAVCGLRLKICNEELLETTANEFLIYYDWRYRRTKKGIDALCSHCRSHKK